jgi:ADP-heptose:LPS heptosyltransferase
VLEGLRRSIGYVAARYHFRRSRDRIISFTEAVSSAHQALLILPLRHEEFLPTIMVVDLLKKRFEEENITVVTGDHGVEVMRMLPRSQFIHILVHEINLLYLPSADVIQRVKKKKFDLAIDLNLDFVLPSAYICRESDARVRIGFVRRRADAFYNFQIQHDPTLGRKLIYDRLAMCLQKF